MMFSVLKWVVYIGSLGFIELEQACMCEHCDQIFEIGEDAEMIRHSVQKHGMKVDRYGNVYFADPVWDTKEIE